MTYLVETTITHLIEAESADEAREKACDLTKTSGYESAEICVHLHAPGTPE